MTKDPKIYLNHILESIKLAQEYVDKTEEKDFLNSSQLQDSVIRRMEIIGEAVRKIPMEWRKQYANVPWREITGMRDILIHEYFAVDLRATWSTVKNDLPKLERKLKK